MHRITTAAPALSPRKCVDCTASHRARHCRCNANMEVCSIGVAIFNFDNAIAKISPSGGCIFSSSKDKHENQPFRRLYFSSMKDKQDARGMMELFPPQGGTFGLLLPCRGVGNRDHGHGLWFPLCGIGTATHGCCRLPFWRNRIHTCGMSVRWE